MVLDIKTEVEREEFSIDGQVFHLSRQDDVSPRESVTLHNIGIMLMKFEEARTAEGEIDDRLGQKLESGLDDAIRIVVHEEIGEVLGKLSLSHKIAIMQAFTKAAGMGDLAAVANPSTGEQSSPSFSDSTEATPSSG